MKLRKNQLKLTNRKSKREKTWYRIKYKQKNHEWKKDSSTSNQFQKGKGLLLEVNLSHIKSHSRREFIIRNKFKPN